MALPPNIAQACKAPLLSSPASSLQEVWYFGQAISELPGAHGPVEAAVFSTVLHPMTAQGRFPGFPVLPLAHRSFHTLPIWRDSC